MNKDVGQLERFAPLEAAEPNWIPGQRVPFLRLSIHRRTGDHGTHRKMLLGQSTLPKTGS
jgi:hypothetical protein